MAVEVDSPEERMALRRGRVWEGDEVECDVADDALLVEDFTNGIADGLHVHVGKGLLGEEAARVDVLFGGEAIN